MMAANTPQSTRLGYVISTVQPSKTLSILGFIIIQSSKLSLGLKATEKVPFWAWRSRRDSVKLSFFFFSFSVCFRATPVANGSSEARGWIRAAAAGPTSRPQQGQIRGKSLQCRILNPLSKARDRTHVLMDTIGFVNLLSHDGKSKLRF